MHTPSKERKISANNPSNLLFAEPQSKESSELISSSNVTDRLDLVSARQSGIEFEGNNSLSI